MGQRVLVIQGQGEIPCVAGARQDGDVPDHVTVEAKALVIRGDAVEIAAEGDASVKGEGVRLEGQVYVNGEELEDLITRIVLAILASMKLGG